MVVPVLWILPGNTLLLNKSSFLEEEYFKINKLRK